MPDNSLVPPRDQFLQHVLGIDHENERISEFHVNLAFREVFSAFKTLLAYMDQREKELTEKILQRETVQNVRRNRFADCETVREVLGQLAGAASMCWSEGGVPGERIFDSSLAGEFVDDAEKIISEIMGPKWK